MDNEKRALLSQMTFSATCGCNLLHQIKDRDVDGLMDEDFTDVLKQSLYNITSPGWCGILDNVATNSISVLVRQMREPPPHIVANQIAWVSLPVIMHVVEILSLHS